MTTQPIVPNTNFPLSVGTVVVAGNPQKIDTLINTVWHRFLTSIQTAIAELQRTSPPTGAVFPYQGASAPTGWVVVAGFPVLPAGYIWIKRA